MLRETKERRGPPKDSYSSGWYMCTQFVNLQEDIFGNKAGETCVDPSASRFTDRKGRPETCSWKMKVTAGSHCSWYLARSTSGHLCDSSAIGALPNLREG